MSVAASNPIANLQRLRIALSRHEHIILLSHMRAYSSLFGHIMGSHPSICGYYEMHIGYYSWRSFVRQKLLYFRDEARKPNFRYMFDKVLHNDHEVTQDILNHPRARIIFALRPPAKSIPSILKLYQSIDPQHEFNDPQFSTGYYIDRLNTIERMASSMHGKFFYMDAEALVSNPSDTLASLTQWLQLDAPLSPDYQLQKKTAQERVGDNSERLSAGRIAKKTSASNSIAVSSDLIEKAQPVYLRVRQSLIAGCHSAQTANPQT